MKSATTFHLKVKEFDPRLLLNIFEFETPYQADRLSETLRTFIGKPLKCVLSPTTKKKSAEALGLYFGCLLPATALDTLGLRYDTKQIYQDYKFHRQRGKISQKVLDAVDDMLRLEFHYKYTRTVKGAVYRLPKELAPEDNQALLELIDKVMEWRNEQGYPFIDVEAYKNYLDSAPLK